MGEPFVLDTAGGNSNQPKEADHHGKRKSNDTENNARAKRVAVEKTSDSACSALSLSAQGHTASTVKRRGSDLVPGNGSVHPSRLEKGLIQGYKDVMVKNQEHTDFETDHSANHSASEASIFSPTKWLDSNIGVLSNTPNTAHWALPTVLQPRGANQPSLGPAAGDMSNLPTFQPSRSEKNPWEAGEVVVIDDSESESEVKSEHDLNLSADMRFGTNSSRHTGPGVYGIHLPCSSRGSKTILVYQLSDGQ